ncbi:MAG: hypothetical protein Q4D95_01555 [Peptoniphilus sp.]|nr:hypothetical protein [Peptoniphilus sp.]
MENIINRLAYLEGLAEGYEINAEKKEGRILLELMDIVSEMAEEIKNRQDEIEEYIDLIEEDLTNLEDYVYEEDDDYYDDFDYDDYDYDDDSFFDDYEDECECGGDCNCSDPEPMEE